MAEVKPNWKSLWEEKAYHNERAEGKLVIWIGSLQELLISLHFCQKLTI
jgi:hypothetical protein